MDIVLLMLLLLLENYYQTKCISRSKTLKQI